MSRFLRQSTASQSRTIGPFVDDVDPKTPETGLTIANTDIKLMVNGGASANKNSGGGTHRANGNYGVTFDATDTATVGELKVSVVVAGALPVDEVFTVLEEAVYDALFVASAPGYVANAPVNVAQISGDSDAADALEALLDGDGADLAVSTLAVDAFSCAGNFAVAGAVSCNGFVNTSYFLVDGATTLSGAFTATHAGNDIRLGATAVGLIQSGLATAAALTTLAGKFTGITLLAQWLGALMGKQTPNSTALTEINATGAGSGTYSAVTDSLEARRDGDFNATEKASINTEADTALADYDAPTKAEMDAAIPTAAANAAAVWATQLWSGFAASKAVRKILAFLMARRSGLSEGTGTATMRDPGNTTDELDVTVNADGNITNVDFKS